MGSRRTLSWQLARASVRLGQQSMALQEHQNAFQGHEQFRVIAALARHRYITVRASRSQLA